MQVLGRLYSKTITWQGDPTSAPAPVLTQFVSPPAPAPSRPATVITRIGDPNAAPAVVTATQAPLLVQPVQAPQPRAAVLLAASSADIYFSGPLVSTPIPQRPQAPAAIIVRQLQDGAVTPVGGPVLTALITTRPLASWWRPQVTSIAALLDQALLSTATAAPLVVSSQQPPAKTRVLTWQQLQDGFVPPAGGPVPITLIVSCGQGPRVAPSVLAIFAVPGPVGTAAPLVVQAPGGSLRGLGLTLVSQAPQDQATFVTAGTSPVSVITRHRVQRRKPFVITAWGSAPSGPPVTFAPIDPGTASPGSTGYIAPGSPGLARLAGAIR